MHDHRRARCPAWPRNFARAAAVLLTITAGAFSYACSGGVRTTPTGSALGRLPRGVQPADLNLLVITLDTTRADRLGAYGWPDSATPALDLIAREGVLFEHAVSPAPLTLPAHASLFTGKYPPQHGVRDNGGFFLDERETTLAERLKARGLKTGGFVGAYVLDRVWGIAQGFDTYFDNFDLSKFEAPSLAEVERPANEVADHALAWLETVKSSRFFGWVHFYDAHSPYAPPEPYRTRFADRPYLGEIAFVDSQVARIRAFLEAEHLLGKTVVVVLGDHGESLGDHGESTHGFFVYESVLHVPLMILAPYDALRGRRVADVVRSVDVLPTALDLLGLPLADKIEGRSVVPLMTGAVRELGLAAYAEAVYPRYHYGWSDLRSLTSGRFKYVEAPRPELYDLAQDPDETRNVYAERQSLGDRMAAVLRSVDADRDAHVKPAVDVDPDARSRLAALGYVGTFVTTPIADRSRLADPKDKIELFNLVNTARERIHDGKDSEGGLKALREVVSKDPQMIDAWLMMGNEYSRRRELTRALECFQKALALKPDYDLAVFNMANVYRTLGRDDDALIGYRRLIELDPRNARAHQEAGQVLVDHDKLDEAQKELNRALELQPAMAAARNTLGALRLKQGDVAAGEREIRAALEQKASLRLAHFNLALAAEQRGDFTRAISEYRREIELYPSSYMAQFNLGKAYERLGNADGQLAAYRAAIESNPDFAEGHLFLAKLYLDLGKFAEAIGLARRGTELQPEAELAPLGHFVIADVYAREGRVADAAREAAEGRRLAGRAKKKF
ncbi:MAG TPA: sulfatase-like hydrolase/transferase [Vicinamibacterales bacterium]|nr:sulfatase-like hydrolase/transferase [Vicinamibacterales bacterium]